MDLSEVAQQIYKLHPKDVVGTVADKSRKGTERMKEKTKEVAVSTGRH